MWSQARLTAYITAALAGAAFLASRVGLASYNFETGMVDPYPFNINWLAAVIAGPLAAGMAAVVLWWQKLRGRK